MSREAQDAGHETEVAGRHATNLELFLDLVFVFAVGQIVSVLAGEMSLASFGRGLLLAWLTWWLWSQFAWLGTSIDLSRKSVSQLLILLAVPVTLLMAIAIPDAYGSTGLQFAGAYLVVNLLCLAVQGRGLWADPKARAAWLQYGPLAAVAPILLVIGALFEGNVRVGLWTVVAIISIVSALAGARRNADGSSEWRIDPTHFAERHALFVIIVLGEVVVAIGVAASGSELGFSAAIGVGVVAAAAVACAFWWAYFAFIPEAVETALRRAPLPERGRNVAGWPAMSLRSGIFHWCSGSCSMRWSPSMSSWIPATISAAWTWVYWPLGSHCSPVRLTSSSGRPSIASGPSG